MAARIRATRNMLAKDAIALRQLVNQIKVMKIKVCTTFAVNPTKIKKDLLEIAAR